MNKRDFLINSAVAGVLALGGTLASTPVLAAHADMEKCSGIAKAGKNDCASATNSCAGTASQDRDPGAWIFVPKGTCDKIAGGKVVSK
ncbi:MAG: DUF2282 domain-containing protein [Thiobacillaceae bacterium]|jgi:uncharacterized membrane protein